MFFDGTPNTISYLALLVWPVICIVFFLCYSPLKALTLSVVGGILLLPERVELFDPPIFPAYEKSFAISLGALMGCLVSSQARPLLRHIWREALIFLVLIGVSSTATTVTNTEMITFGPTTLPALQATDAVLMTSTDLLFMLIPFMLAKACVRAPGDARKLLMLIVGAALLYSLLSLFEIRMSPRLHHFFYGFHQHDFPQTIRFGGWRPMVFMGHGLALGIFMTSGLLFAMTLARYKEKIFKVSTKHWTLFLAVVLVLCKSTGAIVYAALLLPVVYFSKGRLQIWIALAFSLFLLLYPWVRQAGVLDTESLIAMIAEHIPDRAQSLAFRFDNEADLLNRALEKPLFGWGGYNRSRVFDEFGLNQTVTDGSWIILLGSRGIMGFFVILGLLVYPVLLCFRKRKEVLASQEGMLIAALCLVVGIRAMELVPNSYFSFLPFFMSGALAGLLSSTSSQPPPPPVTEQRQPIHPPREHIKPPRNKIVRPLRRSCEPS